MGKKLIGYRCNLCRKVIVTRDGRPPVCCGEIDSRKVSVPGHVCLRCGHTTRSRNDKPPVCCGRCKSAYWNVPRKPRDVPQDEREGVGG